MSEETGTSEGDMRVMAPEAVSARWYTKLKILATSISLFVRLTGSFVAAACDGWLRKQSSTIRKLQKFLVPSVVAKSSEVFLPSDVKGTVALRNKLTSILQTISKPIVSYTPKPKWLTRRSTTPPTPTEPDPEESVHVEILHDPSPAPIRADIIFIHGLHGSLFNTWKQGLWGHRKQVQNQPLEHKYKLRESAEVEAEENSLQAEKGGGGRRRCDSRRQPDPDYDHLLENITDLINNIDDKIKESKNGGVASESEDEPYSPCWPRDWLPKDCPGVRVIAVNYTTDPFLWRPVWIAKRIRSSLTQRCQQMEDMLLEIGVGKRPIVWVGHSKGGLFVKQMLVDARGSEYPRLSAMLQQTKGIMFYSVPHRGSSLARWNLPLLRQSIELTEVKKDCQEVLDLHRKFIKLYEENSLKAEVFSFVETILTFMWVTNVRVVSIDSADLGVGSFQGVNIDHREICKPLNRECFLYKELINLIERVLEASKGRRFFGGPRCCRHLSF